MIDARSLVRVQAGRAVLDGLDLRWGRGVLVLRGENGSGKSTLLRVLAGLLPVDAGEVLLDGVSLRRDRARALRAVGYVPERSELPGALTPREVASLAASLRGASAPDDAAVRAHGLDGLCDVRLDGLSLGQRRRADLLAASVGAPRVLLLDEPTNGLDAETAAWLAATLRAHAASGGAAVVATHDEAFAASCGDETVWMRGGRLHAG